MNKPILFVLYISLACCIGFISGVFFGGFYSRDIVSETISQDDEIRMLLDSFGRVWQAHSSVEDLERIRNLEELKALKGKYQRSGLLHARSFKDRAEAMKRKVPNPAAIISLEESVADMEKTFLSGSASE